jgi:F-type H+-transporting ATPase subunit b
MNAIFLVLADAAGSAVEAHGEAHELSAYNPQSPEFWVYAGLTIFILLAVFVGKAPQKIAAALDARIAETRRNLDEAQTLRREAEALLTAAKAQAKASAADAAAVIAHAEAEARGLIEAAEAGAKDLTARRTKMAEEKIAAAQRMAIADVRAQAATAAAGIAATVIAQTHDSQADKSLIEGAIARLN